VQNEVDTEQNSRMPACVWPQSYEAAFVLTHLGPLLERHGVRTKVWLIDHNYDMWGRALALLGTPGLRRYADAIAWHGYAGEPAWMSKVHDAFPDTPMYWTEGGPAYNAPHYALDWHQWGSRFAEIFRNWNRSITAWNLALDENGRPNIGPFDCGGVVTIHSKSGDVARSGQYWALAHYSRHVRRGARRVESSGEIARVAHVAFANPDGGRVLVVSNRGPATTIEVRVGQATAQAPLPARSLTTLTWAR
jgi:glucosylceramidase